MSKVVQRIAGVLVVLVGLAVAGFGVYMVIWGEPRVWSWLWYVVYGVVIALSGVMLYIEGIKGLMKMLRDAPPFG